MTTAPTSQTILFMMVSFPLLNQIFVASGETNQVKNGDDDDDGADKPNDAVHDELSFLCVVKRTVERVKRFRFWDSSEHLCPEASGPRKSRTGRCHAIAAAQLADLLHDLERA